MTVLNEKRDTQKWDDTAGNFTDKAATAKTTLALGDKYTESTGVIKGTSDATITKETDQDLIDKNLTYYYMDDTTKKDSKISLKELDKTNLYNNPNSPITTVSSPDGYTEVMALQAGGELVYVKTTDNKFEFTFKPNQTQNIVSAGVTGATPVGGKRYDILGGTEYTVKVGDDLTSGDDIEVVSTTINVKDLATFYKYIGDNIDTNTFEPKTTGLYIFKRNTEMNDDKYEDSEYTGYFYVAKDTDETGADGKFFALQYENDGSTRSNYVLDKDTYTITRDNTGKETFNPSYSSAESGGKKYYKVNGKYYDENGFEVTGTDLTSAITGASYSDEKYVTLYTAKKDVIKNKELKWTYNASGKVDGTEVEDNGKVYVYKVDSGDSTNTGWYDGTTKLTDTAVTGRLDAATNQKATLTATYYGAENADVISGTKDPSVTNTTDGRYQDSSDDISVIVNLNNINAAEAEAWTAIKNTKYHTGDDAWGATNSDQVTFYYNNDVEEGATTRKLVDSVELSSATQKNAYLGFDFDLNVNMESKQITIDDNGKEAFETVNNSSWGQTGVMGDAYGTHTESPAQSGTEIDQIAWAEYPTT